jgi:hypothetical protein
MSTYDVYSPSPQSDKQLFDALVASQDALEEAIAKQKAGGKPSRPRPKARRSECFGGVVVVCLQLVFWAIDYERPASASAYDSQ